MLTSVLESTRSQVNMLKIYAPMPKIIHGDWIIFVAIDKKLCNPKLKYPIASIPNFNANCAAVLSNILIIISSKIVMVMECSGCVWISIILTGISYIHHHREQNVFGFAWRSIAISKYAPILETPSRRNSA